MLGKFEAEQFNGPEDQNGPQRNPPKTEIQGTANRIQLRKGSGLRDPNDETNQTPHVRIDRPTYLLGILIAPLKRLSEAVTNVTLVIKKLYIF